MNIPRCIVIEVHTRPFSRSRMWSDARSARAMMVSVGFLCREAAYRRLLDRVNRSAEKVKNIPEGEIDAAIDEAADFVRHNPE